MDLPDRGHHPAAAALPVGYLGQEHDEIDGVLGSGSREAIRTYQRSNGLTADGVGTRALIDHLETGT